MILTRSDTWKLCQAGAVLLPELIGVDRARLLWAIGGNESTFGERATPRHEIAYCPNAKGRYASKALHDRFGCFSCCSVGPWQIMFSNAYDGDQTLTPAVLDSTPRIALTATCRFLSAKIAAQGAKTLRDVGDLWNSGNCRDDIVPTEYITKLQASYAVSPPMLKGT